MALNYRGGSSHPEATVVTAAAPRSSGQAVVEQAIAGFAATSAATGAKYAVWHSRGEFEIPFITGAVKGSRVYINTTTFALTAVAQGTAPVNGTQYFGVVTAVPGDGPDTNTAREPLTGNMWVNLVAQSA